MGDAIRAIAGEAFDLTFATSPRHTGATVTLDALYGLDGVDTGLDGASAALVFPVTMAEGSSGVYFTEVLLGSQGPLWARFSINGAEVGTRIIRVVGDGHPAEDAQSGVSYTVASVISSTPATMEVSLYDSTGASAGLDAAGAAYSYPQSMTQVPGYTDSWYFTPVVFSEKMRVQVALDPPSGPSYADVLTVFEEVQTGTLAHFNGWEPDASYDADSWVSLWYIRRWTGWTQGHMSDEDLRELRRTAIETFIDETNMWAPAWSGTWHGLVGQGSRLYLPVPVLLPSNGGMDPVVTYVQPEGDQTSVEVLSNDDIEWYVRGKNSKQPYIKRHASSWDHSLHVKIQATWGLVGFNGTLPIKVMQVIVGLVRWHALSFSVDADDSRDQASLNRIVREASRDVSVQYDSIALGYGVTGDRTIDRALAELRINDGPWIRRGGNLP